MRILIGIFAFIIWTFVSIQWYVCGIKELCKEKTSINEIVSGNLLFYASNDKPLINEQTRSLKDSLVNELLSNPKAKLQITGQFYSKEENHTQFSNLGVARANKVHSLLFNDLDSASIIIASSTFKPDELNNQKLFRAAEFAILKDSFVSRINIEKLTVYFPFAKSKTDIPEILADSLNTLVNTIAKSNRIVLIEGHTDNIGSTGDNLNLGLARAEWVKGLMILYGIDNNKFEIKSLGEGMPIDNNSTETGRTKNRRVEISTKPLN